MKLRPPFKIHGGKYYLESWILEHFPKSYETYTYVEPYMGAASVFLNKIPSVEMEILNDLDLGAVQIFRSLRDESKAFIARIKRTKYTEATFNRALKRKDLEDYLDYGINEFIIRRMSRGGLKQAFAWSDRKRGGQPGDVNAWKTITDQLPEISTRLQNAYILNRPAIEVIKAFSDPNTLVYADPPYLPDTRTAPNAYELELSMEQHEELGQVLNSFKGKAVISGYPSALYKRMYKNWKCIQKKVANHSSQAKKKPIKTECIWINY